MPSPLAFVLSLPVRFYRRVISPLKPPTCRFHPTCSSYALGALRIHGALKGSWLTARRLCRCHPFCEPGYDPVPELGAHDKDLEPASDPTALPFGKTDRAPPP